MKPNKLPNGVDFCDMVGNVIRSEKNPLSGKVRKREQAAGPALGQLCPDCACMFVAVRGYLVRARGLSHQYCQSCFYLLSHLAIPTSMFGSCVLLKKLEHAPS